jgi:hypothetical protein
MDTQTSKSTGTKSTTSNKVNNDVHVYIHVLNTNDKIELAFNFTFQYKQIVCEFFVVCYRCIHEKNIQVSVVNYD